MRRTKGESGRRADRAPSAGISHKLRKIVADIDERGNANLVRLTVLKRWFETPRRLRSFGIFIARQASQRHEATKGTAELFREAHELLADVDIFEPNIPRTAAARLHGLLEAFQSEHRSLTWTSVRLIRDRNLFLVEGGLSLYLWHSNSPAQGYHLAADYCEHYDPRYGNGLNGPSAARIEEIAAFVLATEVHEDAASKLPSTDRKALRGRGIGGLAAKS